MITTTVSFRVSAGKNAEALEHLQSVARLVKKHSGQDARILTQLGGPIGHYVIVGTYENLGAFEEARNKLTSDTAFHKLQVQSGELNLFIPGTTQSAIFQQV